MCSLFSIVHKYQTRIRVADRDKFIASLWIATVISFILHASLIKNEADKTMIKHFFLKDKRLSIWV